MKLNILQFMSWVVVVLFVATAPSVASAQSVRSPLPSPEKEAPQPEADGRLEIEQPRLHEEAVVHADNTDSTPPSKARRLYRIGAFSFAVAAALPSIAGISLGMDVALYGQEFHNQARTFSLLNATLGTLAAAGIVWPLGLALDGNGDFVPVVLSALVAGASGIGVMYAWSHGDPDRLLAQSFIPGFAAFVSAILAYEMTSDTSAGYREKTGEGDAWIHIAPAVGPADRGATVGLIGSF